MVILLLTAKGVDLHLEPDDKHRYTRHVSSPKDLGSPSLTLHVKLDFLKMNRISFFEKVIDRALRNNIAHADFEIDDIGKFFRLTTEGPKREVDIREKIGCYANYVGSIGKIFNEQMAKALKPQHPR